jgi:hypothetical protein
MELPEYPLFLAKAAVYKGEYRRRELRLYQGGGPWTAYWRLYRRRKHRLYTERRN